MPKIKPTPRNADELREARSQYVAKLQSCVRLQTADESRRSSPPPTENVPQLRYSGSSGSSTSSPRTPTPVPESRPASYHDEILALRRKDLYWSGFTWKSPTHTELPKSETARSSTSNACQEVVDLGSEIGGSHRVSAGEIVSLFDAIWNIGQKAGEEWERTQQEKAALFRSSSLILPRASAALPTDMPDRESQFSIAKPGREETLRLVLNGMPRYETGEFFELTCLTNEDSMRRAICNDDPGLDKIQANTVVNLREKVRLPLHELLKRALPSPSTCVWAGWRLKRTKIANVEKWSNGPGEEFKNCHLQARVNQYREHKKLVKASLRLSDIPQTGYLDPEPETKPLEGFEQILTVERLKKERRSTGEDYMTPKEEVAFNALRKWELERDIERLTAVERSIAEARRRTEQFPLFSQYSIRRTKKKRRVPRKYHEDSESLYSEPRDGQTETSSVRRPFRYDDGIDEIDDIDWADNVAVNRAPSLYSDDSNLISANTTPRQRPGQLELINAQMALRNYINTTGPTLSSSFAVKHQSLASIDEAVELSERVRGSQPVRKAEDNNPYTRMQHMLGSAAHCSDLKELANDEEQRFADVDDDN